MPRRSAFSLATLEACLSASNLPLRHSTVLTPSSPSTFLSLRENPFQKSEKNVCLNIENLKEKEEEEPTSIFYQLSCSFLFGLSLQPFLDLNLQYTAVPSHTPPAKLFTISICILKYGNQDMWFFFSLYVWCRIYAYAKNKNTTIDVRKLSSDSLDSSCLTLSDGLYIHYPKPEGTHFCYFVGKW